MKCEDCLPLIDLYFDGEMDHRGAAAVAAHLGGCASCRAEHQRLCDEQALYLRHECGGVDGPAFWEGLLTKVRAERYARLGSPFVRTRRRLSPLLSYLSVPRFSPTLTAAMLLAAVGLTAIIMKSLSPPEDVPDRAVAARTGGGSAASRPDAADNNTSGGTVNSVGSKTAQGSASGEARAGARGRGGKVQSPGVATARRASGMPAAPAREASPDKLVREAERRYLAAIAILSRDVGRRRPRMAPEAVARLDSSLAAIDRAIAETRGAAREHPRDPVAVQYMLAAYAKKVEVLREMAQD